MTREAVLSPSGLRVRSDCRAGQGQIICYQFVNGAWIQVGSTIVPTPVPNPQPGPPQAQWLNCQQCRGVNVGVGQLQSAICEVCTL